MHQTNHQPYKTTHKVRFVTATSLFDGHDASTNIIRRILQSSGAEVIHLRHNRSVSEIVTAAVVETRNRRKNPRFAELGEEEIYGPAGNAMILERVASELTPEQQTALSVFLASQWDDIRAVASRMVAPIE